MKWFGMYPTAILMAHRVSSATWAMPITLLYSYESEKGDLEEMESIDIVGCVLPGASLEENSRFFDELCISRAFITSMAQEILLHVQHGGGTGRQAE